MSEIAENIDKLTNEELLGPPKYDGAGVLMAFLASLLVGIIVGIIVIFTSFVVIGKFTMESGASPVLLAFVTFFALTIGNILYAQLISYIFPHIFWRHRTSLAQVVITSILIYILFIPVYTAISWVSTETRIILVAFSAHVVIDVFILTLILGLISRYRYSLLTLYSSVTSFLLSSMIVIMIQVNLSKSESALFILLGLPIMAFTLSATITMVISWLYYRTYTLTGADPIGSVFARIEDEEKDGESRITKELTRFTP